MARLSGTGGMNGRRSEAHAQTPRETLLTPVWAWEWLFARWEPMASSTIVDLSTCGYQGWTAGGRLADMHGREVILGDLEPLAPQCRFTGAPIHEGDFLLTPLPPGPKTLITNGAFKHYPEWLKYARRHFDEIVFLCRVGFIFAAGGDRARALHAYLGPAKRMAFELLPEEGRRRQAWNEAHAEAIKKGKLKALDVQEDSDTLTGWRCNPTGVDHGFAIWRRGYTGPTALVIERATGVEGAQLGLMAAFGGMSITTDLQFEWGVGG